MYVTKKYPIKMKDLYYAISNMFLNDYNQNTNQQLSDKDIKNGLEYTMSFGKNNENQSTVILREYEKPSVYQTEVVSNRGRTSIRYELNQISDTETKITYSEETKLPNIFSKINYKILYLFMKKNLNNKMENTLDAIYKVALELKEKESEN
ncbi:DUF3284 domain-containing protein [Carnobacteriaceae bacterium 52-44]